MKKKKKKDSNSDNLNKLRTNIIKYGKSYPYPINIDFKDQKTNSWFDIKKSDGLNFNNTLNVLSDLNETDNYRTQSIKLLLTNDQRIIIDKWLEIYILMKNRTIKLIKDYMYRKTEIPNLKNMKKLLKNDKNTIHNQSLLSINNKNIYINKHTLDNAINDTLMSYKTAMTNYYNGNTNFPRFRYIKLNKPNKSIKIEKEAFTKNTFCKRSLGVVKCSTPNFNYLNNINTICILIKRNKDYYLLLKYPKGPEIIPHRKDKSIFIDPGVRPVLTGYSNDSVIKIGTNVSKIIKNHLIHIKNIRNKNINKNRRNERSRKIKKIYNRIRNRINDLHWKSIKFLINNFHNIIIGNLSTKSCGEKSNINKMVKQIGNMISIYQFKQKLKYKSKYTSTNFREQNEAYTSKCCRECGKLNTKLGGNKIFKCNNCKLVEDRDIGSSIKILLVSL